MTERELYGVRDLHKRIRELELHLSTLRRRVQSLVPELDGMPRGTTIQSRVEKLALELVDDGLELESLREQILFAAVWLAGQIKRALPDPQERSVAMLRYVSCLDWRAISIRLNQSDSTTFRLHRVAFEKLTVD